MRNKVLKVEHLSKIYTENNVIAVDDVNFEINEGEIVTLIGPSGSGKSSLLRTINRMIEASSGTVTFLDHDVLSSKRKELKEIRKKIGMIFQHYHLVYRLNVLENVLHGKLSDYNAFQSFLGLYKNEDIENALLIIKQIGLEGKEYERCGKLSGGQKQRVGIARALIQKPKLILCDEPIASLDPQNSKVIMEMLKEIAHEMRIPVLVSLHQVDVAMKYSDRILGMAKGKMVFSGKPKELKDSDIEKIYNVKRKELISNIELDAE